MRCERCGAPACCFDVYGARLCRRCLLSSIMDRALRWLRKASPRRRDEMILALRGDPQSGAALRIVQSLERGFDVRIAVLEVGRRPIHRPSAEALGLDYAFVRAAPSTYTEFRVLLGRFTPHRFADALLILPDSLEDLAAYALGEVFLGDLRGLSLDAALRVAYPLAAVSLRELLQAFPGELGGAPELYSASRARGLVEWIMMSSPTLCHSTVTALLTLARLRWSKA